MLYDLQLTPFGDGFHFSGKRLAGAQSAAQKAMLILLRDVDAEVNEPRYGTSFYQILGGNAGIDKISFQQGAIETTCAQARQQVVQGSDLRLTDEEVLKDLKPTVAQTGRDALSFEVVVTTVAGTSATQIVT